jgi:hypothetical protein
MRNREMARAYWVLVSVVVLVGLVASFTAHGQKDQLVYFTNQSNIFLGVVAAWVAWRLWNEEEAHPALLTSAVLFICITGLVYNVVLAPTAAPQHGLGAFSTVVQHRVTPLMGLGGWLVFHRHGGLTWKHAAIWLVYPLSYFAFAIVRGLIVTSGGLRYPYPFLDVVKHGYAGVLENAVMYALIFWIMGLILVSVDRGLSRRLIAVEP